VTTSQRIDGGKEPGVDQVAPRKVALVANCLLNQNAKVCEGARYRGLVSPVVEALRSRGYQLQQLPCPELAFAGEAQNNRDKNVNDQAAHNEFPPGESWVPHGPEWYA